MKVIVTGATGMVGEGVLLECLANAAVDHVLSVSRKPCGHTHPKLEECLVPDFRVRGQKNLKRSYRLALPLLPVMGLLFPALTLDDVGKAMIHCVVSGAPKSVLEVPDIAALANPKR